MEGDLNPVGETTRLFRISEPDLSELERTLPLLIDEIQFAIEGLTPIGRKRARRIQQILSSVRWGYGPYTEIERVSDETGGQ